MAQVFISDLAKYIKLDKSTTLKQVKRAGVTIDKQRLASNGNQLTAYLTNENLEKFLLWRKQNGYEDVKIPGINLLKKESEHSNKEQLSSSITVPLNLLVEKSDNNKTVISIQRANSMLSYILLPNEKERLIQLLQDI